MRECTDLPQPPNTSASSENLSWIVREGEKVRVGSDESVAIKLQEDVVGWNPRMRNVSFRLCFIPTFNAAPVMVYIYISNSNKVQWMDNYNNNPDFRKSHLPHHATLLH